MSDAPPLEHGFPTRAERRASAKARTGTAKHSGDAGEVVKKRPDRLIPLLIVLIGVLVVLYPVVATQYNNFKQHRFAVEYNSDILNIPDDRLAQGLASARAYNDSIVGIPILDPYLEEVQQPESSEFARYLDQLSASDVMARVRVPSAGIDLPVRHGTSESSIRNGAGHLYGTSLPVGGLGTHAVITSHTGMSSATLFDHLVDVKEGDLILIDVYGETLAYAVDQIKVVLPDEIGDLVPVTDHDYLTLFTCTPYAVNSHRLLVRAERTEWTPEVEAASEASDAWIPRLEWWMWVLLGAAFVGLAGIIVGMLASRRRRGLGGEGASIAPTPEELPGAGSAPKHRARDARGARPTAQAGGADAGSWRKALSGAEGAAPDVRGLRYSPARSTGPPRRGGRGLSPQ